jgi:hypothetical protein
MTRLVRQRKGAEDVRVYLSGPMPAGAPRCNVPAFEDACDRLRAEGYHVTSPHEMDLSRGTGAALKTEATAIKRADLVALLPGWESSPGANAAVMLARAYGVPCLELAAVLAVAHSA